MDRLGLQRTEFLPNSIIIILIKSIEVDWKMPERLWPRLPRCAQAFAAACGGNITLIFAFSLPILLMAGGGGIDLMRAFQARQKLSEVASLARQYASRPSVMQMASANSSNPNAAEPLRVSRRLQLLRGWSHDEAKHTLFA